MNINPTPDALADEGPIADAARSIASWCEGSARINVYKAAKRVLADSLEAFHAKPVVGGARQARAGDRVTIKDEREVYGDGTVISVEGDTVKVAWDSDPRVCWSFADDIQLLSPASEPAALQSPPPVVAGEAVELDSPLAVERRHELIYKAIQRAEQFLHGLMDGEALDKEATEIHAELHEAAFLYVTTPLVVEEGRREAERTERTELCYLIERMCPDKPESNLGNPAGSQVEALADAILALTPVEGVGEITEEQVRTHYRYRSLHEDFVTVETDLRNCAILIGHHYNSLRPVADKLKEVLSTPATAQGDVREALGELEVTERNYRLQHDLHGGDDMRTGKAWDQMRRAGDRARALLSTLKGQDNG